MSKKIVIALGGNALGNTAAEQLSLVSSTAKAIVDLIGSNGAVTRTEALTRVISVD